VYIVHIVAGYVNIVNIRGRIHLVTAHGYHHGALHEAILTAAVDAAAEGGPAAIGVRPLAKAVGVSPSAIYRHIPSIDVLLAEVSQIARQQLAVRMIESRDRTRHRRTRKTFARERFRSVGLGYIEFAIEQPHLFDTALAPCSQLPPGPDEPSAWQVLADGVAELVDAGIVAPRAADEAALIAWSGVQGIASILARNALPDPFEDEHATSVVLEAIMGSLERL
jgi:AcrR family transcriptional regulator